MIDASLEMGRIKFGNFRSNCIERRRASRDSASIRYTTRCTARTFCYARGRWRKPTSTPPPGSITKGSLVEERKMADMYGRGAMIATQRPECAAFGERHRAVPTASQPAMGLDPRESRPPSFFGGHRPPAPSHGGASARHVPL